jgi:transposase
VTEHRCEPKCCPACQKVTTAVSPEAPEPTQYGPRLSSFAVYLPVGHFVPVVRTCDIIQTLTGSRPSQGWILMCQKRISGHLDGFIDRVKALLRNTAAVCCDETGFRFCSKRYWMHVCSTAMLNFILVSRSRGSIAIREMGIFGNIRQVAIHDHYSSCFTINTAHGMCNAHHIRELTYVLEEMVQPWAKRMIRVLLDGKALKESHHPFGRLVPDDLVRKITARYRRALTAGYAANPAPPAPLAPERGRRKCGTVRCLLDRLRTREEDTLRFLVDPNVPWENNQAERDLGMANGAAEGQWRIPHRGWGLYLRTLPLVSRHTAHAGPGPDDWDQARTPWECLETKAGHAEEEATTRSVNGGHPLGQWVCSSARAARARLCA